MIIGIISDTHDNVFGIKKAVDIFKKKNPEFVIHLGDVIASPTARLFAGLRMKFIRGNCDGELTGLKKAISDIDGEFLGETAEITVDGKEFFLCHGKIEDKLNMAISSGKYDYVLHGHTHRKRDETIGRTRVINPGSLYLGMESRSFALLDVKKDTLDFVELNTKIKAL